MRWGAFIIIIALGAPALAQDKPPESPVDATLKIGIGAQLTKFAGIVRSGGVAPLRLELDERAGRDLDGDVVFDEDFALGDGAVTRHLKLRVPFRLERKGHIALPLEVAFPPRVVTLAQGGLALAASNPTTMTGYVRDRAGKQIGQLEVIRQEVTDPLYIVLDPDHVGLVTHSLDISLADDPRNDDSEDAPSKPLPRKGRFWATAIAQDLPASPSAYEGTDAVVVPALAWSALPADRRRALLDYTAAGGTLVVSGGPGAASVFRSAPIAADLSITTDLSRKPDEAPRQLSMEEAAKEAVKDAEEKAKVEKLEPEADVKASLHRVGFHLGPRGNVRIARIRALPGTRVLARGDGGEDLVVESRRGLGRIVVLAFGLDDPALKGMPGWRELSRLILARGASATVARPPIDWGGPLDPLARLTTTLAGQVGIPTPPVSDVLLFLGVYVVTLVPGAALVFRAIKRLELFWFVVPLVAVGFSIWIGARARALYGGSTAIVEARVIELGSGADRGPSRRLLAILSTERRRYRIDLPPGERPAFAPAPGRAQSQTLELVANDRGGVGVENFEILLGEVALLESRGDAGLGGPIDLELETGLLKKYGSVVGDVVNRTGRDLEDVWVIRGGEAASLGRIAAGERLRVDVRPGAPPANGGTDLASTIFQHCVGPGAMSDEPVLFARVDAVGDPPVLDSSPVRTRGATVVLVHPHTSLGRGPIKLDQRDFDIRVVSRASSKKRELTDAGDEPRAGLWRVAITPRFPTRGDLRDLKVRVACPVSASPGNPTEWLELRLTDGRGARDVRRVTGAAGDRMQSCVLDHATSLEDLLLEVETSSGDVRADLSRLAIEIEGERR